MCVCARWKFIGLELGFDIGTLEIIDADHRNVEDCLTNLIATWLSNAIPRPTRSAMKAALQTEHVLSGAGNYQHAHNVNIPDL